MPAVSKAQQRFMGMVHATQKGDMESPSKEVEKVADTMKKVDAKDFASTKHKGLPAHVKERLKEIIRGVMRAEGAFGSVIGGPEDGRNLTEMSPNDTHFKGIMAMYDKGGSFAKKKVGAAVSKNPNASRNQIVDDLKDLDYQEILDTEAQLGLDETITEEFKHLISVETPTQIVSKPIAAQILALAKKGVRSSEIGLKMGFVGNQKAATDAFQKVKNKIYFSLDKRNESINEIEYKDAVEKFNADLMKNSQVERIAKFHKKSIKDVVKALQPYLKVLRYSDKSIKVISIDFRDTNSDVKVHVSQTYKQNESVNEAFNVRDLPTWLFDDPVDFEDWYEDGMKLDKGKGKLAPFSSSDEKKLFQLVGIWQDSEGDYQFGRGDYGTGKTTGARSASYTAQDDIKKFLTQKGKVVDESLSEAKYPTEEHDCGCNENYDCGCGGLHTH